MRLGDDHFREGGASRRERSQPRGWTPAGRPSGVARLPSPPLPTLTERGTVEDYHDQAQAHGRVLRGGGNLLGGRAVRHDLLPLTSAELPDLSLDKALNRGLLPSHYLSDRASSRLAAYVGDYLREEVLAEALTRNLPAFQRFLEAAALSNGQIVNAATISREIGVAANTVRGYFDILVDTLIATWVPAWTRRTKRRVIQAPRFWFFDVGIVNELARRGTFMPGSTDYGAAFEHFIFMELRAHATYSPRDIGLPVSYWRTASGSEVDFILGNAEVAVEVKSTDRPASDHLKGLRAWQEEHPRSRCILVCRAPRPRRAEPGIEILPWREFLGSLWRNEIRAG